MGALRAASPLRIGDVTLVPIERAGIQADRGEAGCWVSAFMEAVAVVAIDAGGVRALAVDSSQIALDALVEETPDLGAILSGLSAS